MKNPKIPLFLPANGPLDAEYVESLWLDACIEGATLASDFLLTIRNCLLEDQACLPGVWVIEEVVTQLEAVFSGPRLMGLMENIVFMLHRERVVPRGEEVIALELTAAILTELSRRHLPGRVRRRGFARWH
jgi:hypothetical protein